MMKFLLCLFEKENVPYFILLYLHNKKTAYRIPWHHKKRGKK